MNCEKEVRLIDALVEGELDDKTAENLSLHIYSCPTCSLHLEMLEREKEIYSHYLFEVEPPVDLAARFQNRLEIEKPRLIMAADSSFFSQVIAFLRFNPVFGAAAVLVLLAAGFGLMIFVKDDGPLEKASNQQNIQLILPKINIAPDESRLPEPEPVVDIARNDRDKPETDPKPVAIKQTIAKKPAIKSKDSLVPVKLSDEEQAQIKLVRDLEEQTAKQLEKVELLLRSFRNARLLDGSEVFDISYEKQQARKLLQANIELRQRAEAYGTLFTEQMLSRVEPYLLDIANLDLNSSTEQVLEIKQRVKNQNIIASLQGF